MKKTMAILLLLAMLPVAGIISAAGDSEASRAVAVDLFGVRGENTVWLGTAVPVYDGVVLASAAILPDDLSQLVITDGVTTWNAEMAIPDHSDMLMTVIYDSTKLPYTVTPFSMTDLHEVGSVSELTILAGDENMSRINRTVYSVVPFTWQSVPCLQASVSGPVEPGALLITKDGKLVGIAVANWAEGTDKVVFITSDGMIQSMAESLDAMIDQGESDPPEGFTVTLDGNVAHFDWAAMTLPETGEGEQLYLVVSDVLNNYLTYCPIEGSTSHTMILTPGRTYHSGIMASVETPDTTPRAYAVTTLPPAEKMTDYGFASVVCAIAEAPEKGLPDGELPVPVTRVTEELLRSGRAYFYSSTSYQVTETMEGISLLVTLTDPDGNNYRYESSWIYDPSYMEDDTWAVSLDSAGLLNMLNETGYPEGTYEVCMYIGGALADSFTFDLP